MSDNGLAVKEIFQDRDDDAQTMGVSSILGYLAVVGDLAPAWWSPARDIFLRKFTKEEDHLSGTVNTLSEMMTAIPAKVVAKNNAIKSHVAQADEWTEWLKTNVESRSNFAATGWTYFFTPLMRDLHTTDNGGFFAIEGPGRPDGPLTGMPTKLIHLDSVNCQRTRSKEFPIVFTDYDGKRYKLHKSRVVSLTSASDTDSNMLGVGLCAVSRAIHIAQEFADIARYKGEKLGSRRRRAILVGRGFAPKDIIAALSMGDEAMDNMGLTRFAQFPILADKTKTDAGLDIIDLASIPDGFDEMQNAQLGVATLALAFGVDMRQLAFAFSVTGVTKADAEVSNMKMWGKGPGFIIQQVKEQFAAKVLPPHLQLEFDYQDDGQDKMVGDIKFKRSERHKMDTETTVINIRVAREQMLYDGDITDAQFEQLELADGRLEDGSSVLTLFFSSDFEIAALLHLGLPNPIVISQNDPATILPLIDAQILVAMDRSVNAQTANLKSKAKQALAALQHLKSLYEAEQNKQKMEEQFQQGDGDNEGMGEKRDGKDGGKLGDGGNQRLNNGNNTRGTQSTEADLGDASKKKELWYKQSEREIDDYQDELASLIEQGTNGEIDKDEFENSVEEITTALLLLLFLRGSGLSESDLTKEERQRLDGETKQALKQVPNLADDVYSGKFTEEGGNSILARVALWVGYASGVYALGQLFKRDDKSLQWNFTPGKDHCIDCKNFNGQVKKRSEWLKLGFWPKSYNLACVGLHCGCYFTEV